MNNSIQPVNIAILGASGYTGAELLRLLPAHPYACITALTAHAHAGKPVDAVFPHLTGHNLPSLTTIDAVDFSEIDIVFCCLPHATTQTVLRDLPEHVRIIDLSADFRLTDIHAYERWYGQPHQAQSLQQEAVYGLTEHYRERIAPVRLIANPGCYPTCSLLALLPLASNRLIDTSRVIIDAKSGVSGAGRSVKQHLLYNEVAEGMQPYGVNQHRHMAEMEQEITAFGGTSPGITFVPHLVPQRRGMIATIYANLHEGVTYDQARNMLAQAYAPEPFVTLLDEGVVPSTHSVRGTNHCHLNLFPGTGDDQIILISAIDNLVKGASGQAIQNLNVMLGVDETLGLQGGAIFP